MAARPGVKLIYCLKRLPHLTPGEFSRHWREVHAPLELLEDERRFVDLPRSPIFLVEEHAILP